MKKRINRKLEHLRQQPDHVRLKKVSTYVIISAAGVLVLWLFLLLPIQLHLQVKPDGGSPGLITALLQPATNEEEASEIANTAPTTSRQPQVGGAQKYRRPLPSGPFFKTASPGATPSAPATAPSTQTTPSPTTIPETSPSPAAATTTPTPSPGA